VKTTRGLLSNEFQIRATLEPYMYITVMI